MGKKSSADGDRPKRPMSSYMLFANDMRSQLKSENPDAPITEIAKLTGQAWKEADEATKKKYQKKHDAAMAKYNEIVADMPAVTKSGKRKKEKDPNAPKRPMSAYFLWFNDNRQRLKDENPGSSVTDLGKIAGAAWRDLDDEDKEEYQGKAAEAKEAYEEAMSEYNATKKKK